jgi:hypothetical protein
MLLSLTHSPVTPHQAEQAEALLAEFLQRLTADQPGVVAVLRS